jgi:hypothetical protein
MLSQATLDPRETWLENPMNVGDRVRVTQAVTFYHHPLKRNEPSSAEGMEGVISAVLTDWQGRPISANFPVVVEFEVEGAKRPFKAHFTQNELELI